MEKWNQNKTDPDKQINKVVVLYFLLLREIIVIVVTQRQVELPMSAEPLNTSNPKHVHPHPGWLCKKGQGKNVNTKSKFPPL